MSSKSFINISSSLTTRNNLDNELFKITDRNRFIIYLFSKHKCQTKNIYNKINLSKLKGIYKYKNFPLFQKREIEFRRKNKKKINLSFKRKNTSFNNSQQTLSTKNSLYITQSFFKGDFSKLPLLFEKISKMSNEKKKLKREHSFEVDKKIKNIRLNYKDIKKSLDNSSSEKDKKDEYKIHFLRKLEKENKNKKSISKTDSFLEKKSFPLNMSKILNQKSLIHYFSRLREYLISKQKFEFKNEQYRSINEDNSNEMEQANQIIKEVNDCKKMFSSRFMQKYNEYFRHLNFERDKQYNNDVILCGYINSLRIEMNHLDSKIKKIKNIKNKYIKWMLLQYQVKEKKLKLPKYFEYLNDYTNSNNVKTNESEEKLINYMKNNHIFDHPDYIFTYLARYEAINLELLSKYNNLRKGIDLIKKELIEVENDNKRIEVDFSEELNSRKKIKMKLFEQYTILSNSKKLLTTDTKYISFTSDSQLYKKVKQLKDNLEGEKKYKPCRGINEIINMLKYIEINIDLCLKKQKYYLEKYKKRVDEENKKLENIKKTERILLYRKNMFMKIKQLKEKIIEKSNKVPYLPTKKMWFKNKDLHKEQKASLIKDNTVNFDDILFSNIYNDLESEEYSKDIK